MHVIPWHLGVLRTERLDWHGCGPGTGANAGTNTSTGTGVAADVGARACGVVDSNVNADSFAKRIRFLHRVRKTLRC